jgi:hypothetical protein
MMHLQPPPHSGSGSSADMSEAPEMRVLYMFSGPSAREDGVGTFTAMAGERDGRKVSVVYVDVLNGDEFDMADQVKFEDLLARVQSGIFCAALLSPPCSTFSRARGRPGGPRVVRGVTGAERYGLRDLKPHEKEAVRLGTLLATRAAAVASACHGAGIPWLLENPAERTGETSIFNLDELVKLCTMEGIIHNTIDQCMFGSEYKKATDFRGNISIDCRVCNHTRKWVQIDGKWQQATHPPLRGMSQGGFKTRVTAAYPADLNKVIGEALVGAALARAAVQARPVEQAQPAKEEQLVRTGWWSNSLVRASEVPSKSTSSALPRGPCAANFQSAVDFVAPLRGAVQTNSRKEINKLSIGGLRDTAGAVDRLAHARQAGAKIRADLEALLNKRHDIEQACVIAIGDTDPSAGPTPEQLREVRRCLAAAVGATSCEPYAPAGTRCSIAGDILQSWASMCGDPDIEAATWTYLGAPAGIREHPKQVGIFPDAVEDSGCVDPESAIFEDPEFRQSYATVENDDHAWEEVHRLVKKGYLTRLMTLDACKDELDGEEPVVSKFGMIVKTKAGKTKRRLILDAKESGVTQCGRKNERIVLPSVIDFVFDTLDLHRNCDDFELLEWMVLDVTDAFWTLSLRKSERRFFVGKLRGMYFVYNRLAQGSRGAPLAWCRFFALVVRLTIAMFSKDECRAQVYVDDPAMTFCGKPATRRRAKALVIAVWRALNLDLSFKKGQEGHAVSWIGSRLLLTRSGVLAMLQADTIKELSDTIDEILKHNVVSHKLLRSLAGKLSNAARVLTAWRPFLGEIWAALYHDKPNAPSGTVWTRQVTPALRWFAAFLGRRSISIMRPFLYRAYTLPASKTMFVVDASPWGIGAVLVENGVIKEYVCEQITSDDCEILGVTVGSPNSQQILEALAMLVSLRTWREAWQQWRCTVAVRGDNVTMLSMVLHFKGSTPALATIARELALEIAAAAYRPILAEHIPGVANVTADALSRAFVPEGAYALPSCLHKVPQASVQRRERSWYRALGSPDSPPMASG